MAHCSSSFIGTPFAISCELPPGHDGSHEHDTGGAYYRWGDKGEHPALLALRTARRSLENIADTNGAELLLDVGIIRAQLGTIHMYLTGDPG